MSVRSAYSKKRVPILTTIEELEPHNEPRGGSQFSDYDEDEEQVFEDAKEYTSRASSPVTDDYGESLIDPGDAIAERLRKLPGFETYQCRGSESGGSIRDANPTHNGTGSDFMARIEFWNDLRSNSNLQASVGELLTARERLKILYRMRKGIVSVQSKIDETNRKIARARKAFLKELEELDRLLEKGATEASFSRPSVKFQLSSLHQCSDDLKREEADLEILTERFNQAQWNLREKEKLLYSQYATGIKTEDSEASEEDRIFESRLTDPSLRKLPIPMSNMIQFGEHLQKPDRIVVTDSDVLLILNENYSTMVSSRPPSIPEAATRRAKSDVVQLDGNPLGPTTAKPLLPTDETIEQHIGSWLELPVPGYGVSLFAATLRRLETQEQATVIPDISSSAMQPQAMAKSTFLSLTNVRRRDFQLLFGYDIQRLESDMHHVKMTDKPARPSKFRGLMDIKVPTVHTSQYIAVWGRDMAQNASLEAYRIYQFGRLDFERLIKIKLQDPLVKLVQDVRQLYVPLDDPKFSKQTFITVNSELDSAEGFDEPDDWSLHNNATGKFVLITYRKLLTGATDPDSKPESKRS